jgi:MSHA biogenesis protein MshP
MNPKPETRNPKPETRNPEPETRNPKPETRNPKPETRNPKPETRNPKPETGFSLLSAIFLLVVIAALGTFAVTLSTTQQQSTALDVMGSRAYHAARAGVEWGAYQVLQNGGACAATTTLPAMTGTLGDFSVTVTCTSTPYTEDDATKNVYQLTSKATQGTVATANYVERVISVTIAK